MQHRDKLFPVVLENIPAWYRSGLHNLEPYDGPFGNAHRSTAPTILLLTLTDVAEAVRTNDLGRTYTALSILSVFSLLQEHALVNIVGNRTPRYDWSHADWVKRFKDRIDKLPGDNLDASRYHDVVHMLLAGSLSPTVLDRWATWLVEQPGYSRAWHLDPPSDPPHDKQVRARHAERNALQAFIQKVYRLILGDSVGVAHSLGKALPVGMAVFHPDSTRRRRHEEQRERALGALPARSEW